MKKYVFRPYSKIFPELFQKEKERIASNVNLQLVTVAHYGMPHGEAVALGCAVEAHLSMRLGYLSEKDFEQILGVYSRFPLKLPKAYIRTKLLSAMAHDKKKH